MFLHKYMETSTGGSIRNFLTHSLTNTCAHTHISVIAVIEDYISVHFTDSKLDGEEDLCLWGKEKFPEETAVI